MSTQEKSWPCVDTSSGIHSVCAYVYVYVYVCVCVCRVVSTHVYLHLALPHAVPPCTQRTCVALRSSTSICPPVTSCCVVDFGRARRMKSWSNGWCVYVCVCAWMAARASRGMTFVRTNGEKNVIGEPRCTVSVMMTPACSLPRTHTHTRRG